MLWQNGWKNFILKNTEMSTNACLLIFQHKKGPLLWTSSHTANAKLLVLMRKNLEQTLSLQCWPQLNSILFHFCLATCIQHHEAAPYGLGAVVAWRQLTGNNAESCTASSTRSSSFAGTFVVPQPLQPDKGHNRPTDPNWTVWSAVRHFVHTSSSSSFHHR